MGRLASCIRAERLVQLKTGTESSNQDCRVFRGTAFAADGGGVIGPFTGGRNSSCFGSDMGDSFGGVTPGSTGGTTGGVVVSDGIAAGTDAG